MKPFDFNSALSLQTINECLRGLPEEGLVHSKGKPGVPPMTTNINVRFANSLPVEIEIQHREKIPERKQPVTPGFLPMAPPSPTTTTGEFFLLLVMLALVGCGRHSEDNSPVSTNVDQVAPGAVAPATANWNNTNNPVTTNSMNTNNPAVTNQ